MSAFLAGLGTGFFGGLAEQQREVREENRVKRTRLMDHYMNVAIPQYHKTKSQAKELQNMVATLEGAGYSRQDSIEAVQMSKGDPAAALDYLRTYRSLAKDNRPPGTATGAAVAQAASLTSTPTAAGQGAAPSPTAQTAPGAPQSAAGGTSAPLAAAGPQAQPSSTMDSVRGFWDNVILGKEPVSAIHDSIANDIAAMYGVGADQVQNWMASAYQSPMEMAGLEARGTPDPIDVGRAERRTRAAEYLSPRNMENIPSGKRVAFTEAIQNWAETGDAALLDQALAIPLDVAGQVEAKAQAETGVATEAAGGKLGRLERAEQYLSMDTMAVVPKAQRREYTSGIQSWIETGDEETLNAALAIPMDIAEAEAAEAASGAGAPSRGTTSSFIGKLHSQVASRFGDFDKDAEGKIVFKNLEPALRSDYSIVSAVAESMLWDADRAGRAINTAEFASTAIQMYNAGLIEGTTLYKKQGGKKEPQETQAPLVSTQEEYDALEPGTQYKDPEGNIRTKR